MLTLRRSAYVLGATFIALFSAYLYSARRGPDWLKDVSLNVGTEVLGILLTVLLIDAVIRRKDQAERDRVVKVAFVQLRIGLQQHVGVLQSMYKASISHPPHNLPKTLNELFGPDYFVQVAFLDFSKPAPLASVKPLQWFDYLHMEMEQFKATLTRTLEKYAVCLDPNTVELLEEIIASSFIGFLTQVKSIPALDQKEGFQRQYNFFSAQGMPDLTRQHIELIKRLSLEANHNLPKEKQVGINEQNWRNDIAPTFGSARL